MERLADRYIRGNLARIPAHLVEECRRVAETAADEAADDFEPGVGVLFAKYAEPRMRKAVDELLKQAPPAAEDHARDHTETPAEDATVPAGEVLSQLMRALERPEVISLAAARLEEYSRVSASSPKDWLDWAKSISYTCGPGQKSVRQLERSKWPPDPEQVRRYRAGQVAAFRQGGD